MATIEVNDFSTPDEVRAPERTTVEVVQLGGGQVGRYTFQPGWHWAEHIKPVAGTDSCQTDHLGYVLAGTLDVRLDDGSTATVTAGSTYRIPPGHDAWVVGDTPVVVVEFQGAAHYAAG
jgi:quercetin dioxygenase-like cupin family protein